MRGNDEEASAGEATKASGTYPFFILYYRIYKYRETLEVQ
jgi:hypothetical protein